MEDQIPLELHGKQDGLISWISGTFAIKNWISQNVEKVACGIWSPKMNSLLIVSQVTICKANCHSVTSTNKIISFV